MPRRGVDVGDFPRETLQAFARVLSLNSRTLQLFQLVSCKVAALALAPAVGTPHTQGWRRSRQQASRSLKGLMLQKYIAGTLPPPKVQAQESVQRQRERPQRLYHCLKPKGPGCNDRSLAERIMNVTTSLPFVTVGLQTLRERRQAEGRLYGASILAIGLAATAYHATSGKLRTAFRKADYWTISLSSVAMTKALHPERMQNRWAKVASAASLAAIPFQPTLVTACHAAAMEVEFAKRAGSSPQLRASHCRHGIAAGIGIGCFLVEDAAIQRGIHWVHSIWHCLACYGVASTNLLLEHKEDMHAQQLA